MNDKTRIGKRRGLVAAAIGVGFLLTVGAALATPGMGILAAPVQARGTLGPNVGPNLVVNSKTGVHLKALGSTNIVTQQIRIAPGGEHRVAQPPRACSRDRQVRFHSALLRVGHVVPGCRLRSGRQLYRPRRRERAHREGVTVRRGRAVGHVLRAWERSIRSVQARRIRPGYRLLARGRRRGGI